MPQNVSIIALQETWNIPFLETIQLENFNFIHKQRESGNGGGIGFYVKKGIDFSIKSEFSPFTAKVFESLTLELPLKKGNLLISSVYRSPSSDIPTFLSNLDNHLINLSSHKTPAFVCLDSNINTLKVNNLHPHFPYLQTIFENGFYQIINKATRFSNLSFTLIDHILTNFHTPSINCGVLITDVSDHLMTLTSIPHFSPKPSSHKPPPTRTLTRAQILNLKNALSQFSWQNVLETNDVNESYENFWDTLSPLLDLYFPYKTPKFNKNFHKIHSYMTSGLLTSRRNKAVLHKQSILQPTPENISYYKTFRNIYNKLIRASKKLYFENELYRARKNPKKTWSILKEALNINSSCEKIQKLTVNGQSITDPTSIATHFNNFFENAGKSVARSIPKSNVKPESFLPEITYPEFRLGSTSQTEIRDILKSFDPKTSNDMCGISMKLLKEISNEISHPLSHIFNLSLAQGVFPDKLKLSRVVPVHKNGKTDICDNFRPIALQSNISKILEKLVCTKLTNHLDLNKIIHPSQFGFQRFKNTEQNLIHFVNFISEALNNGDFCIGVFLDLKKAFDTVDHQILLMKLEYYGIKGLELNWFKSYLSNRSQVVDIDGHFSNPVDIDISVLQGSILGPILFNIFINDLPHQSSITTFLFADDTQGLMKGKNLPALITDLNKELTKWATWFRSNRLGVNVSKTKYIIFHNKGKVIDNGGLSVVFDNNEPSSPFNPNLVTPLERIQSSNEPSSQYYKLLGILFDENLNFNYQISNLSSKLSKAIYFLNKTKNILPPKALKSLYFAYFHSHLLYCPIINSCTSHSNVQKIVKLQKKAIRIVAGCIMSE